METVGAIVDAVLVVLNFNVTVKVVELGTIPKFCNIILF